MRDSVMFAAGADGIALVAVLGKTAPYQSRATCITRLLNESLSGAKPRPGPGSSWWSRAGQLRHRASLPLGSAIAAAEGAGPDRTRRSFEVFQRAKLAPVPRERMLLAVPAIVTGACLASEAAGCRAGSCTSFWSTR